MDYKDDQMFKILNKLSNKTKNKTKNKPNKVKDSLYENLSMMDKIKLLLSNDHDLLIKLFPTFSKIIFITQLIFMIAIPLIYIGYDIYLISNNLKFGFTILIYMIFYITLLIIHFYNINEDYVNSNKALIFHYIILLLNLGFIIVIIQFLSFMYLCKGKELFKKDVNNQEQIFINNFNQIFVDKNETVYLRHEMIKNVWFDNYPKFIKFDYIDKFYDNNTYNLDDNEDEQYKRVLTNYIKNHTSRELNFKQLISKLVYINNLTILDQSSQNIDQNKKDNKLLDQLIDKQVSQDEILRQQFESFNN